PRRVSHNSEWRTPLPDRRRAKRELGRIVIVASAGQPDIRHRRLAACGEGPDVMEFDEPGRSTSLPVFSDKCAAPEIPQPDCALHLGRDVARIWSRSPSGARLPGRRELLARELLQKQRERSVEDLGDIAVWDMVPEHVLRKPELVVGFLTECALHLVGVGGKRRNDGGTRRERQSGPNRY